MRMSRFIIGLAAAMALCGCIGSAPRAPENWAIELSRAGDVGLGGLESCSEMVRIAQVSVRPPYDGTRLAVLRSDGTIAFDPYNAFAVSPGLMLRGAIQDATAASGAFRCALSANTSAACSLTLETTVTRIALDCRKEGRRDAIIELTMLLLKGREPVASAHTEGKAATSDSDYSAAFSRALAKAARSALEEIASQCSAPQQQ